MAIRFAQPPDSEDQLIATINTTPLVDVMLVLLIIFLITIPVVTSSIAVTLPLEPAQAQGQGQAEDVIVTVDAQGAIYWFDTRLPTQKDLAELLERAAALKPQPELHIRADARADYESIGQVVYAAQQSGMARIGFLTEPPEGR